MYTKQKRVIVLDYQKLIKAYEKHKTYTAAARSLGMARKTYTTHLKKALKAQQDAKPEKTCMTKYGMKIISETVTIVYFTDAHNQPDLPTDRFKWLAKYVNEIDPEYLIDGGDFDDLQSLCSHERNDSFSGKFKPAFQDDLAASEKARKIIDETLTVQPIKHVTLGNHEQRLWDFENSNPETFGMMQHAYLDILDRYGWNVTKYRDYLTVAGIDFTHIPMTVMNRPVGGKTPCNIVSRDSIKDVCFGHTHGLGLQVSHKLGPCRSVIAFNGGCFMPDKYMPAYAKGSQKEFWYGCHKLESNNGRLHIAESITMNELKKRYS